MEQVIFSVEDVLVETRKGGVSDKLAKLILCVLIGADSKDIARDCATLLINVIDPKLTEEGTSYDEVEVYHYGLTQLIHDCTVAQHAGILKNFQVKKVIDDCWRYPYVGFDLVQYCIATGMLDTVEGNALDIILDEVIAANEKAVKEIKGGKDKAIGALVGQVMKKQKVDPAEVKERLIIKIKTLNMTMTLHEVTVTVTNKEGIER